MTKQEAIEAIEELEQAKKDEPPHRQAEIDLIIKALKDRDADDE